MNVYNISLPSGFLVVGTKGFPLLLACLWPCNSCTTTIQGQRNHEYDVVNYGSNSFVNEYFRRHE